MLNCVIVDDEPLAREGMANYVKDVAFLQLVDTCVNPVELGKLLSEKNIDLIFLDIQMPKMNGIDFLRVVQKPPMVIITTAFPGYALEGFQLNVLDYLLKPITFDRFHKAAKKPMTILNCPPAPPRWMIIKTHRRRIISLSSAGINTRKFNLPISSMPRDYKIM
ncbi:LytR/AlgR family response regulator transcription factor [Paraflavitalea speifideaquila]|uniref:LytR/AlgR family response regulator transcription factor n=1 Tax=Paraflavitalea speifideaquila TaxID=3076558 RepID=UPI0028ED9F67|nr:response regulator [Paraflavitalea speifideiaquila]